jgi:hypothetical protein
MLTAAALCPAPPLLARELTGADPVLPELREACREAVDELIRADADVVVVVGVASEERAFDRRARLDVTTYAPALRRHGHGADRAGSDPLSPLPLTIGLGSRLLDGAGYHGRSELQSVGEGTSPAACAALGARLAAAAPRVALLVMADGSARRSRRAPGYLDVRAEPFDAEVGRAIRVGDMPALLALDAALATDLMATGRPALQVLAGAAAGRRPSCVVRYDDAPFGVGYLVASLWLG